MWDKRSAAKRKAHYLKGIEGQEKAVRRVCMVGSGASVATGEAFSRAHMAIDCGWRVFIIVEGSCPVSVLHFVQLLRSGAGSGVTTKDLHPTVSFTNHLLNPL